MIHYMLLQFGQLNNAELLTNVVRASDCATIIMFGYLTIFRKCIRTASGRFFQYVMKFMFQKRLTTNCAVFKSPRGEGVPTYLCVCVGGGGGGGEGGVGVPPKPSNPHPISDPQKYFFISYFRPKFRYRYSIKQDEKHTTITP